MSMEELDKAIAYDTERLRALEEMWASIGLKKGEDDLCDLVQFYKRRAMDATWKKKRIIAEEQLKAAGWTDPIPDYLQVRMIAEILPKLSTAQKAFLFQSLKDRIKHGWCD